MARARNVKPSFFTNDTLAELPALARLLFIGLWTLADREGRLEDRPKKIKAEVLPYDDCDADALLGALHGRGFILRYQVQEGRFIQVVKFAKHQNPHVREPASAIPAPDEHSASTVPEPDEHRTGPALSPFPFPDSSTRPSRGSPDVSVRRKAACKSAIPDGFCASERVKAWAAEQRYGRLDEHLAHFVGYAKANGKTYADWDQAFMNAIRADWAKLREPMRVNGRAGGSPIMLPTAATPDEAILRRISERHGGAAVERLSDGRLKCGVHYFRPSGEPEVAL
jgi:hypothetical protein